MERLFDLIMALLNVLISTSGTDIKILLEDIRGKLYTYDQYQRQETNTLKAEIDDLEMRVEVIGRLELCMDGHFSVSRLKVLKALRCVTREDIGLDLLDTLERRHGCWTEARIQVNKTMVDELVSRLDKTDTEAMISCRLVYQAPLVRDI